MTNGPIGPRKPGGVKSTNVRFRAIRGLFAGLSRIAPGATAALAGVLFRRPPRHRGPDIDRSAFDGGERMQLRVDGARLAVWKFGEGPTALLVHGWGSRAARLGSFVAPLTAAGFSVVAFDAPGHGESDGRLSSLPQFLFALRELSTRFGPIEAVVAHSMGGAATTLAMARGLAVRRAVFLAPAADPAGYSERFAATVGLSPAVLVRMKAGLERRFGLPWRDFDVLAAAAKQIAPLLVVHDRDDRDIPVSEGEAYARAWPGARLVTTAGLGHRRIVHDPSVVAQAVGFLTEEKSTTRLSGRG
jgi:pimeloyl-ACP methyl ester carboxylesterase